ncbi:winged helix-turn-helix transcriptional regulator [Streptomyces coelicoflavus]|uniref:winged helix-turn-helix transcriptional regulator n=1 Tax=Streptomyces coelicoflavus TaxID=285562 RepID=UPI00386C0FDA
MHSPSRAVCRPHCLQAPALRQLQRDGLVERHVVAATPVQVEYRLIPEGHDLDRSSTRSSRGRTPGSPCPARARSPDASRSARASGGPCPDGPFAGRIWRPRWSTARLARRAVDARQRLVFGGPAHRDRTGVAADEPDRLGRDRRRHRRPGPATGAGTFVCHNGSRVCRSPTRRLPWPRRPVGFPPPRAGGRSPALRPELGAVAAVRRSQVGGRADGPVLTSKG